MALAGIGADTLLPILTSSLVAFVAGWLIGTRGLGSPSPASGSNLPTSAALPADTCRADELLASSSGSGSGGGGGGGGGGGAAEPPTPAVSEGKVVGEEGDGEKEEEDDDDESDEDEEEKEFEGVPPGELKMVFVVRSDLGMGKGKTAAQVGHATLGAYRRALRKPLWERYVLAWQQRGQAKITLKVDKEEDMDAIAQACAEANLPFYVVTDAGRTQIPEGSRTVLGIGPAPVAFIDRITGPGGSHPCKLLS